MNLLATIRQRQVPWTRRVLGLFVVMWLNLALQPCAMAMGDENEHDCPHCPPAQTRQHDNDNHHDHGMPAHELTEDAMRCASEPGACGAFDGITHEGRTAPPKLEYSPNDVSVALLPVEPNTHIARSVAQECSLPTRPLTPGYPPPLNVLYCVYLN